MALKRAAKPKAAPKPRAAMTGIAPRHLVDARLTIAPPFKLELPVLYSKEEILESIDKATEPRVMDAEAAHKFLERLVCDIECRMEGLRDDMKNSKTE